MARAPWEQGRPFDAKWQGGFQGGPTLGWNQIAGPNTVWKSGVGWVPQSAAEAPPAQPQTATAEQLFPQPQAGPQDPTAFAQSGGSLGQFQQPTNVAASTYDPSTGLPDLGAAGSPSDVGAGALAPLAGWQGFGVQEGDPTRPDTSWFQPDPALFPPGVAGQQPAAAGTTGAAAPTAGAGAPGGGGGGKGGTGGPGGIGGPAPGGGVVAGYPNVPGSPADIRQILAQLLQGGGQFGQTTPPAMPQIPDVLALSQAAIQNELQRQQTAAANEAAATGSYGSRDLAFNQAQIGRQAAEALGRVAPQTAQEQYQLNAQAQQLAAQQRLAYAALVSRLLGAGGGGLV